MHSLPNSFRMTGWRFFIEGERVDNVPFDICTGISIQVPRTLIKHFEKHNDLLERNIRQFNLPTAVVSPEKNGQIIPLCKLSLPTQNYVELA